MPLNLPLSSTNKRSAVLRPIPGILVNFASSSFSTAVANCETDIADKIASANFGPTPLVLISSRNKVRSCF